MPISLDSIAARENTKERSRYFQLVLHRIASRFTAFLYENRERVKKMHERTSARPTTPETASAMEEEEEFQSERRKYQRQQLLGSFLLECNFCSEKYSMLEKHGNLV